MRQLELLAPAKNLECGIAAIEHGADAVYIGASNFGARVAASNTLDDIRLLCDYAHKFTAKVFVTVNTIVYDEELDETFNLLKSLAEIGVDAILVQDMAVVSKLINKGVNTLGIALHASTQTDNRSADKVQWLQSVGFERAVLARELSLDEITAIHTAVPDMELETFVHGALCVSYSGVCYASQHCFDRSANRGACAQFCRLKFDLLDSDDTVIESQRHLLSLKDMCRIDDLESLAEAGVTSFKIEGRLKDADYVKNVVAAYNKKLNEVVAKNKDKYCRASIGNVEYGFEPNLNKTFNRGFTNYFLRSRQPDIVSFDTPKAMGEYVGKVKEIRSDSFNVAGLASFANGDGLCFINDEHELEGFRVNRVEGNRLFPFKMPRNLRSGLVLYRNNDEAFSKLLAKQSAVRKIPVKMIFEATDEGFILTMQVIGRHMSRSEELNTSKELAKKSQRDNIIRQLSKLGNTPYQCEEVDIRGEADKYFIPASVLTELRRKVAEQTLLKSEKPSEHKLTITDTPAKYWQSEYKNYPYIFNISNHIAREFYESHGLNVESSAFELAKGSDARAVTEPLIMQCRHCLRFSLGYCVKRGGNSPTWKEPLYLRLGDGRRFRLQFNCNECQMNVYASK